MNDEFCLNDEVRDCPCNKCNSKVIYLEDVKEFIRLLKQEFRIELKSKQTPEAQKDKVCNQLLEDLYYKPLDKVIDKLAGSKLL